MTVRNVSWPGYWLGCSTSVKHWQITGIVNSTLGHSTNQATNLDLGTGSIALTLIAAQIVYRGSIRSPSIVHGASLCLWKWWWWWSIRQLDSMVVSASCSEPAAKPRKANDQRSNVIKWCLPACPSTPLCIHCAHAN